MVAIGLRNRILLLVALGLLIATAPLGVMGLGMVRAATDRILEERLALAQAAADHLSLELSRGWSQLEQLSSLAAVASGSGGMSAPGLDRTTLSAQMLLFSGGVVLLDEKGRIVRAEPHSASLSLVELLPTARAAMATGLRQTGVSINPSAAHHLAVFAVPVHRTAGTVIGAAVGIIDLNRPTLLSFITGMAMGSSGHAVIVGRDGYVLATTESAKLFSRDEHPDFFRTLIDGGRRLVASTKEAGDGRQPEPHVMAFAPLSAAPWGVGIGQSEAEAFGPIQGLRDRIIVFETLVLLVALIFAWVDTTAVVRPLGALRGAAERIAEGDLAHQVDVRRGDEIGALARTFETMRRRLLQSLDENARLQERLRSVAMLEERERLAREIHDSVGQVLGYVNTKAQAVSALLEAGRVREAGAQVAQLEEAAREVYADLREAILNLRTTTTPGERLLPSLVDYVRRFSELSGVETRLIVDGDPARYEFTPTAQVHLVRIVQEALTNVRKHAAARHAVVRFAAHNGSTILTIEDDGRGIVPAGAGQQGTGFGLQTMRERARAIGGAMTVRPTVSGGTEVQIVLPSPDEGR